jgi:hypothetical protein
MKRNVTLCYDAVGLRVIGMQSSAEFAVSYLNRMPVASMVESTKLQGYVHNMAQTAKRMHGRE